MSKLLSIIRVVSITLACLIISNARAEGGFYGIANMGSTAFDTGADQKFSGNSWNFGIGYQINKFSFELLYGSMFHLGMEDSSEKMVLDLTSTTYLLSYKIIDAGTFQPVIGIGQTTPSLSMKIDDVEVVAGDAKTRNMYMIGLDIPLEERTFLTFRYTNTFGDKAEGQFSNSSIGAIFKF
jgi:hypothetical protein